MGYEWLDIGMRALRDIEPGEVMQALASQRRRPIPATGPDGHQVLSIWSRTKTGLGLIIALRPLSHWDWQIIAARIMTAAEDAEHRAWEASRDE